MEALAYLIAFHRDGEVKVRPIVIPEDAYPMTPDPVMSVFEQAFYYGQNDFQPVPGCYSVSVGDVVEIPVDGVPMRRLVEGAGFSDPLTDEQFKGLMDV